MWTSGVRHNVEFFESAFHRVHHTGHEPVLGSRTTNTDTKPHMRVTRGDLRNGCREEQCSERCTVIAFNGPELGQRVYLADRHLRWWRHPIFFGVETKGKRDPLDLGTNAKDMGK